MFVTEGLRGLLVLFLVLFLRVKKSSCIGISIEKNDLSLSIEAGSKHLNLLLKKGGVEKLSAQIGDGLPTTNLSECPGIQHCLKYSNGIRVRVIDDFDSGFRIIWISNDIRHVLRDCYVLDASKTNWYGGPERIQQNWPIEKLKLDNLAYVVREQDWTAVIESYWLNSRGAFIYVEERVPLFVDQNHYKKDFVCFIAKVEEPYKNRTRVLLEYVIAAKDDPKQAHLYAINKFMKKPKGLPNYKMVQRPIWSTWARYKVNINDSVVRSFAQQIVDHGFRDGQLEIDDFWETCYGSLEFSQTKFPNINETVRFLKDKGFRVTLWVHPFVNEDCTEFASVGKQNNFFSRNEQGSIDTRWWNGQKAYVLDATNGEATEWFVSRLRRLQRLHGIDSFKFDAGETNWCPPTPVLTGDIETCPNKFTKDFIRTYEQFGDMIEERLGWKTQDVPHFIRMLDKQSSWGLYNGLHATITSLLQMNMIGYTRVLPDMVGGNGYDKPPSPELYVRWLQANTFMPAVQLSYVPWDFENPKFDVLKISKKFVDLHTQYADGIIAAMEASVRVGSPVNAPVWWVDPDNKQAHAEDSEFLLGDDILVAPVIKEGARSRDVFLPSGVWLDGNNGTYYFGNRTIRNYPAPIDVLPYFVKVEGGEGLIASRPFVVNTR